MNRKDKGFTLLEVMIAVGIFGIIMLAITQMMRAEIRFFSNEDLQNQYEQKARVAMNHVLDQVRLNGYVRYKNPGTYDEGFYADPGQTRCVLNINPNPLGNHLNTQMVYNPSQRQLWFRQNSSSPSYLIADQISVLEIQGITENLARVRIKADKPDSDVSFELVTWVRLY